MIKKITQLVVVAAVALSCSMSFGQAFTFLNPLQDLGIPTGGVGPFNTTFDISSELGLLPGSVNLNIVNGFTNAASASSAFTVSNDDETIFTLTGPVQVLAQVSHGSFLGAPSATPGENPRDGVSGVESFTLVSSLDATSDFQFGSTPNFDGIPGGGEFFVEDLGNSVQNSSNFLFQSVEPVTTFTVFSSNTNQLNNNFSVGFAVAVPEPASGLVLTCLTGLFGLRRNRRV